MAILVEGMITSKLDRQVSVTDCLSEHPSWLLPKCALKSCSQRREIKGRIEEDATNRLSLVDMSIFPTKTAPRSIPSFSPPVARISIDLARTDNGMASAYRLEMGSSLLVINLGSSEVPIRPIRNRRTIWIGAIFSSSAASFLSIFWRAFGRIHSCYISLISIHRSLMACPSISVPGRPRESNSIAKPMTGSQMANHAFHAPLAWDPWMGVINNFQPKIMIMSETARWPVDYSFIACLDQETMMIGFRGAAATGGELDSFCVPPYTRFAR